MDYKGYNFEAWEIGGTLTSSQYERVIDILEEFKPKRICELGAGQSTIIFEKYIEKSKSDFFSIEHDENYSGSNSVMFQLVECTNITIGNNTYENTNKYDGFENWLIKQDKFDFVLIDGPYGYNANYDYTRIQLLSFIILDKISDKSVVICHDTERINMKSTLSEFEKYLLGKGFKYTKDIMKGDINGARELTIYNISL
jgi:16S rRNA G966 N2-methylase RsmD